MNDLPHFLISGYARMALLNMSRAPLGRIKLCDKPRRLSRTRVEKAQLPQLGLMMLVIREPGLLK